jgi:transcriptional regulator with XRE-family HTH domain
MSPVIRFGPFFRQHRRALGLSLREFCRRNGFDPGNISRLERGLLRPPQGKEVLESYAKALKLQPDSHVWDTFFDLAAAETGRIPPQLHADQTRQEALPRLFRGLRGRQREGGRPWVKASDLELWAEAIDARSSLPQVLRRLVHATVDSIVRIEFPAGEGVQRPGWDGMVETPCGNAYVPSGFSAWELSVEKHSRQKAEGDFQNRVKNARGLDTRQVSFIFVTPRKWTTKDKWCAEKNQLGIWKEVRVYDSTNLEEWLETAPAVDAWLARRLGGGPEGVTDIDDHWANLNAMTSPSLKPEVFLVSRQEEIDALTAWLEGPPSALAVEAQAPSEVIDFVAASMASLNEAQRDAVAARILIVKDRDAWSVLSAMRDRLVLIPQPTLVVDAEMVAEAVRQGHHVLLCSHRFANEPVTKRTLPRAYRYNLERALAASGVSDEEASRFARDAGGSLTVLKRRLARFPSTRRPVWSQPPEALSLVPILLAGGWDDTYDADQKVMEKLAGCAYEDVLSVANRWLTSEDPPVMRVHTYWSLVSRQDSWMLLASHITRPQLDKFEEIAIDVLGENDPQYDLSPDERWRAALDKKLPKYSHQLRTGLAETLVLLGAKSDAGLIPDSVGPTRRAERVVQKLLSNNADWKRWASLSDHLPLLAEACPEAFLKAVENDLRRSNPELPKLFEQEGGLLFPSSPHTGLLWALETLAWKPALLTEVSLILARLAQIDPGGQLTNRPIESLQEIFLPWLPHTMALVEQRIRTLDRMVQRFPEVGWQLLLNLLPTPHGVSTSTHLPAWRDWALDWPRRVSIADYWQQVDACADFLLENVGTQVERWKQLIAKFEHVPKPAQDRLLQGLKDFDLTALASDARRQITDVLRNKVQRHGYYADASWALPPETVNALAAIQKRFEPQDVVARHIWLFVASPRLLVESREKSWQEHHEAIFQLRRRALEEILAVKGLPGVFELARVARAPETVAAVLGESALLDCDGDILPQLLVSDDEALATFADGYARGRFAEAGWEWVGRLQLAGWSAEQAGRLTLVLSFERRTWELVDQLGPEVSCHYWSRAGGIPLDSTKEEVEYAVAMLLKHHRPFQAINVLEMALQQKCEIEPSLLMETLDAGLKTGKEEQRPEDISDLAGYEIQEFFERLQSDPRVDIQRLASLEWGYLDLLDGYGASPKTLHAWLQRDPHFFAELLRLIFRSDIEPADAGEPPTGQQKARAQNAYKLLRSWKAVPGTREDGMVDEQELCVWVTTARDVCKETGHLAVCDVKIGEVFAHAPEERDGSWPCIPVRDVIEEIDGAELVHGFEIGIFNKRGSYSKSPTEGGKQERELAAQYTSYADACAIEWPRTAAALRRVARRYEDDARREDERLQARW